ncbi:MAG: hypothetical protein LBR44_07860 [Clostridiales Family XIII bacterium]|jgi:hypothetical protein|nr:hypothetical protein [Clostridiales Family XIII bacterium]
MKKTRIRMAGLAAGLLACAILMAGAAGSAPAPAATPASGASPEVTAYEINNPGGGGNDFSGRLTRDGKIDIILKVRDVGVKAGMVPHARVNTVSFTGLSQAQVEGAAPDYTLIFRDLVYTGVGSSFSCDIFYDGAETAFTTYTLPVNQAVEYVEPASDTAAEVVTKGTGFVLKSASYGQGEVYAGAAFTLSMTLLATNGANNVENVSVGITPPKELSLEQGSSIVYVGTVEPGRSIPVQATLKPAANIEEGSYTITVTVHGVDAKTGTEVGAEMSISVPVLQPERFEIFSAQIPSYLTAGLDDGSGYSEVTLVNQGRGSVGNVSVDVTGDGLSTLEGKQYVGNVAGGEQKLADFTLMAERAGQFDGEVVVTYENARGELKELRHEFSLEAGEGMDGNDGRGEEGVYVDEGMMEEDSAMAGPLGLPRWAWILIGAGAACAVAIPLLVRRRRRKQAEEEALWDDAIN